MTEFKFGNNVHELTDDPETYFGALQNIRGNILFPINGFIQLHESFSDEGSLNKYLSKADEHHQKFTKLLDDIIIIAKKEEVRKSLMSLLVRLKRKSNFDWKKPEKFKKFMQDYQIVLDKIEKLR